jgi:hypothetical protein
VIRRERRLGELECPLGLARDQRRFDRRRRRGCIRCGRRLPRARLAERLRGHGDPVREILGDDHRHRSPRSLAHPQHAERGDHREHESDDEPTH